ncbi:MAG: DUF72 domain-containing protein [Polyangiaceae bacterium]|nr:DUF72 domain-containing protein [Polyangiaceae bacterium]
MRFSAGTSGFSYSEWKGTFYPKDLKSPAMLRYYAGRLHSVEINNTFYRMPSPSLLEGWKSQVPSDFRFILKAPRRITHSEKLAGSEQSLAHLLTTAAVLGESLGPILFQLPPTFKKDLASLTCFLSWLPQTQPAAFEFRHPSWFSEDVYAALGAANAALCGGDVEEVEKCPPLVPTANWGYLRLRKLSYTPAALSAWAKMISQQPWESAYAFFKHETEGPLLAEKLDQLVSGKT